jgi:hypothetical protein
MEKMKVDEQNALKNISAPTEIEVVHRTYEQLAKSKGRVPNPVEASCIAFGRLMEVNQGINDIYNDGVRSGRPTMPGRSGDMSGYPRDASRPGLSDMGPGMDDYFGDRAFHGGRQPEFVPREGGGSRDGFAAGAADYFGDRDGFSPRQYRDGIPEEFARSEPISQPVRPFKQPKLRKDVPHGVEVDEDRFHGMANRISNNRAVMSALATLEYDEDRMTSAQLDSEIEEAIDIQRKDEDEHWGSASRDDISRAASLTSAALPDADDLDDGGDEGSSATSTGGLTHELLGLLIDGEDED